MSRCEGTEIFPIKGDTLLCVSVDLPKIEGCTSFGVQCKKKNCLIGGMSEEDEPNISQESDVLFLGALQESTAKPDPPSQSGDNSDCMKKTFIFRKGLPSSTRLTPPPSSDGLYSASSSGESSPALFKRGIIDSALTARCGGGGGSGVFKRGNTVSVQSQAGVSGPQGKSPLSPKPGTSKPHALDSHKKRNPRPMPPAPGNVVQRNIPMSPRPSTSTAGNQKGNTVPVQNILQIKADGGPSTSNAASIPNQKGTVTPTGRPSLDRKRPPAAALSESESEDFAPKKKQKKTRNLDPDECFELGGLLNQCMNSVIEKERKLSAQLSYWNSELKKHWCSLFQGKGLDKQMLVSFQENIKNFQIYPESLQGDLSQTPHSSPLDAGVNQFGAGFPQDSSDSEDDDDIGLSPIPQGSPVPAPNVGVDMVEDHSDSGYSSNRTRVSDSGYSTMNTTGGEEEEEPEPRVYLEREGRWEWHAQRLPVSRYTFSFRFVNLERLSNPLLVEHAIISNIQDLLGELRSEIHPSDLVQLRLEGEGLNNPLFSLRRHINALDAASFFANIGNLIQSNAEVHLHERASALLPTGCKNIEEGLYVVQG
ncbi:uncharacterized protein [Tiliqua scincoides]|uniref:uncharacterized protein n=2 Tax=Tiliqua scincoides TaxID=71010 RepID=UPI0034620BC8